MKRITILALAIAAFLPILAYGAPFTERLNTIPDLIQTDPRAGFPYGGVHYCGPCAITNSLVWLGENGYERLLPSEGSGLQMQSSLATILASKKYMDTTYEWGTSPASVLNGIAKYLRDCGYEYKQLSYQGWRKVSGKYNTGVGVPELGWVKSGLHGDSAVWLNVGWYKFSRVRNEYRRVGGHWVTLAGFGADESGQEDPNILIIHDPGVTPGCSISNSYVRMVKIQNGTISGAEGKVYNAAGFYRMAGMRMNGNVEAIMDGAVRLEMRKPDSVQPVMTKLPGNSRDAGRETTASMGN